jgi:NAD+ kinase
VALLASPTERAQEAAASLAGCADWVPSEEAEAAVVLGGDGFMLEAMHRMIDSGRMVPIYGLNLGTVGFLMNRYQKNCRVLERMAKARRIAGLAAQDGRDHAIRSECRASTQ